MEASAPSPSWVQALPLTGVLSFSSCSSLCSFFAPTSLHPLAPPPPFHVVLPCFIPSTCSTPRLLEHQLQTQKRSYDVEVEALRGELQSVKEENNRQQQLLAQNLQLPPEARIEASLQHEITRLTNENLVRRCAHGRTTHRPPPDTSALIPTLSCAWCPRSCRQLQDASKTKPTFTLQHILIFVLTS